MADKVRIAILGGGAITRNAHLQTVLSHPDVELVALVDADSKRAASLAATFGAKCQILPVYSSVFTQVDAIINALPNSIHASVNQEALAAGVHVLCEKPLATAASEALACCELAQQKNRLLAVGMNRRFVASQTLLRLVLDDSRLGDLHGYDWEWGGNFDWRSASGFYFTRALAGGGALIDAGVHLLDSVIDWFGPVSAFNYQDDDWGSGIEANVILDLQHDGRYGNVKGRLRISRTCTLKNRFLLSGTRAAAEVPIADPETVILHNQVAGVPITQSLRLEASTFSSSYARQLHNFVESIRGRQELLVDGWQALRVIQLVEDCYSRKQRIPEPWAELKTDTVGTPA
jgi:predicted dehydrogenase